MLKKNFLFFIILAAGLFCAPFFACAADSAVSSQNVVPGAPTQEADPFADSFDEEEVEAVAEQPQMPQITAILEGIGSSGQDAYAIINGDIFYAGEEKKGIKLLEVHKGWVDVLMNGISNKLYLYPEDDLKKAQRGRFKRPSQELPSPGNAEG